MMPPPDTPVLDVLDVRGAVVRYGATVALHGVDLALAPGEWVALLGPNGAGKTSLISALAGLVPLASGTAALGGHAAGTEGARRLLGVVPQELALYASLTVRENLETAAALHGLSRAVARARVAEALEAVGLADRAGDRVSRLSGGMRRRLNVACGVLHRPRVVVLDEPTVGVDPPAREKLRALLQRLRADGAALLQSTHEFDEVERVVDRVIVLDHGRVVAEGTVHRLVEAAAGAERRVTLALDAPLEASDVPRGFALEGRELHGRVTDAGAELGALLARVSASGRRVLDVRVEAPTLADVFARLTQGAAP